MWYTVEAEGYTAITNSSTVKISPKTLTGEMVTVADGGTYDGEAKEPEVTVVDGDPSMVSEDDFDVAYSDNVDAGTATATVTGKGNYTGTVEKQFSIAKATYDMGAVAWDYAGAFQYDGAEHTVLVSGLPSGVTASYTGNSASAPGTYTAHATLAYDAANHNEPVMADLEWVIEANAMSKLAETFASAGEVTTDGEGVWKVTLTNDVAGTVEIPDNVGTVTIDLNGHDITGADGAAAIRIVAGDGDGDATSLSIVDSSEGEKGMVAAGEGESGGIEIADDVADGVEIGVQKDVSVLNGDGTAQAWPEPAPDLETLVVGKYFKATLAELGYDVPTNGTAYSVVAKGLPAGLKLKYNAAVKNKKGKVVTKAKSTWWIEGVPTAAMDFMTNPPYLVITANGKTTTEALPVEVLAQDIVELEDLGLGQTVNEQFYLPSVTNGWTVSGLPTGLKYTAKVIYKDPKAKKKVVKYPAYAVYGKTTKAGLFTITAKKKTGAYYETMKYRVLVRPKAVDVAVFGEELTNIVTMAYVPVEWDLTGGGRGATALPVVSNVVKVAGLPAGVAFAAATTYKDKTKTQVKQYGQTIVGKPTKPGTYVVTFTKNVTTGSGKNKKTVAKTAQILWTVVANDAELELAFNTAGGVVESGVVGLRYGELLAFTATSNATVTASGLPAGMKLVRLEDDGGRGATALPGTDGGESTAEGDGRAASPLAAAWGFEGFTTKAGTYLVTVKATLNGRTVTQRVALVVEGLPAWAKGTFNGYVSGGGRGATALPGGANDGLATITVSAAGKISGKFHEGGTNWTVSAASYTGAEYATDGTPAAQMCDAFVCSNVVAKYAYKAKEKNKKGKWTTVTKYVTRTFTLTVAPVPVVPDVADVAVRGVVAMAESGGSGATALPETTIEAWQNLWGSTYKAVGKALFTTKSGKTTLAYRTFAYEIHVDGDGRFHFAKSGEGGGFTETALPGGASGDGQAGLTYFAGLSLKVTTAGAVTATLTYDTGKTTKDSKTKKTVKVYHKPTCSTVVVPTSAPDAETFTGEVHLFFAPSAANNFDGWNSTLELDLP